MTKSRFQRIRSVAALVATIGLAVAACADSGASAPPASEPTSTTTRPAAKPAPPDQRLRDVTKAMIYQDGIAFVLPETAAQMICGALSPEEWSRVIGSTVGRSVSGGVNASCVLDTGAMVVRLKMTTTDMGSEDERINGRRVSLDDPNRATVSFAGMAAVVAVGEQNLQSQQQISAAPVLFANATVTDRNQPAPDLPALVRRVFTALLPKLAPADKRATPTKDAAGTLAYTPTEPVAGVRIYDLPQPIQGQILCTAALRESRVKAEEAGVRVNSVGDCNLSKPQVFAKVDRFSPAVPESSPLKIAGRSAEERGDKGIFINLLSTPAESGRTESLTLRLRLNAPSEELRSWAEKIANTVLAD